MASAPEDWEQRFRASRRTLFIDAAMARLITIGGVSIIAAVLGIFVFILAQIMPLFEGASVKELATHQLPDDDYLLLGADEWTALPMLLRRDGRPVFLDIERGAAVVEPELDLSDATYTAFNYVQLRQELLYGTDDGRFRITKVNYQPVFEGDDRHIVASLEPGQLYRIGKAGHPLRAIAYGDANGTKLAAALQDVDGKTELHVATLEQKRGLLGAGKIKIGETFDLTADLTAAPTILRVSNQADAVVVAQANGDVLYFSLRGDELRLTQTFQPFRDEANRQVATMDYLFGDVSLVLTNADGVQTIQSLFVPAGAETRLFGETKRLKSLPAAADFYAASLRNKGFVVGSGNLVSLRYATTGAVRWQAELPFTARLAAVPSKYDHLLFLDQSNQLHVLSLHDPHPEAGVRAFFSKLWYEGYSEPTYAWQSTGGADDFEAKLSMVPLLIGTFKGTIYAMMFAVPLALLAAIYSSYFLVPSYKSYLRPTIEIMASLPSVVLGFLAALWLAPLIEDRMPVLLLYVIGCPLAALALGALWERAPDGLRVLVPSGYEFVLLAPALVGLWFVCCWLGPLLEQLIFVVTDPDTGARIADFRLWWPEVTGARFEQRNALVVGFMMGFAAVPIIYTIADDSLSNVPRDVVSASLALGASRWQTMMRVILPSASAGIFSAVMIGFGRAVGETMIVLMATGNTPVMDFNIFSGMRTLSANIAVELPEAPHGGTLYRALFLGAMLLFLLTFCVNTAAEVLRHRLRERFKTV